MTSTRWTAVRTRVVPAARRRLAAAGGRGPSALNIPVPVAEDVALGGYITLMTPFAPRHKLDAQFMESLARVVASCEPFDFVLGRVGRFPQGVLYIAPDSPAPFVELVEALLREWPEYPPYGGAYDTVIPHLTVWFARLVPQLISGGDPEPPGLADELARALPIHASATSVDLVVMEGPRRWSLKARLPLGG
ncbi:MAG: hypothetical protein QOK04_2892 [Solirubrobacteraceae bacterium]|nr:hypothetical protein [Solirubrobacteraceae bacterium]